ncbi:MAG TPA: phospholipase [Anaeromyxobacteraceae bacterium]|nr:phospholipase [Anaeromyxobacteraceae bacterium]
MRLVVTHPALEGAAAPPGGADAGEHALGVARERDALLHLPTRLPTPAPLLVLLHGAGGDARGMLRMVRGVAEERGVVLVAPQSRAPTWDLVLGRTDRDAELLDAALAAAANRVAVDPAHLALGGFSDGASYALSLGLARGAPFTHLVAFSPGFAAPVALSGAPPVFVSHGTADSVLPIARCSRRIVPRLRALGLDVTYLEFDGGHAVPAEVARDALAWWLAPRPQ